MRTGFAFITDSHATGTTPGMVALYDHATNWLLTVDCLTSCRDGLTGAEAARVADAGFIGDDIPAARRFLQSLSAAKD